MIRFVLSATAATMLLAAPMAASAATGHAKPSVKPHVTHVAMKHGKKAAKPAARNAGSAATDSLNEQSLSRARSGQ